MGGASVTRCPSQNLGHPLALPGDGDAQGWGFWAEVMETPRTLVLYLTPRHSASLLGWRNPGNVGRRVKPTPQGKVTAEPSPNYVPTAVKRDTGVPGPFSSVSPQVPTTPGPGCGRANQASHESP